MKSDCPDDIDGYLVEIRERASLLQTFCLGTSEPGLPHGLLCFVRLLLKHIVPKEDLALRLIETVKAVMTSTQSILSRYAVSDEDGYMIDCRGHLITGAPERESLVLMGVWLACKENSMLIETFAEWIMQTKGLTEALREQLDDLAQLTLNVLLSFKHRGAIEKTSIGLSGLCTALSQSEGTSDLPAKYLNLVLNIIQSTESRTAILRKSAGLPPALLSIVRSSDLASKALDFFTEHTQESSHLELRIHSYNIMRAIFLDKVLRQRVETRIAECLALSIQGMASPHWSLRNSSTLLLAAIIERIFGKTSYALIDLEARNPRLVTLLLERLSSGGEVFPLLLLISMVKQDSVPRPELVKAAASQLSSGNAMVRGMTARAIANIGLTSSLEITGHTLSLTVDGVQLSADNPNSLQGLLYCIKELPSVLKVSQLTELFNWELSLRIPAIMQTYLEALQAHKLTSVPAFELAQRLLGEARLTPDLGHSLMRLECLKYSLDSSLASPVTYWASVETLVGTNLEALSNDPEVLEVLLAHCKLHLAAVQSPEAESFCRRVLALQADFAQAEAQRKAIVILRRLSAFTPSDYLSLRQAYFQFKDNEVFVKSCIRALSQSLESPNFGDFLAIIAEVVMDSADFVKHAAALALTKDFLLGCPTSWTLVIRLLEDQCKQVRDQVASLVCSALDCEVTWRPRYLLKIVLRRLGEVFSGEDCLAILVGLAHKYLEFGSLVRSAANRQRIFYVEETNTYMERQRLKLLVAQQYQTLMQHTPHLKETAVNKAFQQRLQTAHPTEPEEVADFRLTFSLFALEALSLEH
jgi:heme exporter protein D